MIKIFNLRFTYTGIGVITCIIIYLIIFIGCKKDKETFYTLSTDGLSYIQLKQGQYFIYKDLATLNLDSIVVTESLIEKLHTAPGYMLGDFSYQNYRLRLSKIDPTGSTTWLSGNATATYSNSNFTMLSASPDLYDQYIFRFPLSAYSGIFPNDSSINTMTVEGKVYSNIIMTTGKNNTESKFYWAKGVGLIKYIKGSSIRKTYTLVRNN